MALTKISTDGVKDDAITKAKIPADQIEASELANNAVDTNAIADQAVALSKLPHGDGSSDGKFLRANNGADPTFETVSGTTINSNSDNRVITGSGTANTLNAESTFTHDPSTLDTSIIHNSNSPADLIIQNNSSGTAAVARLTLTSGSNANSGPMIDLNVGSDSWTLLTPKNAGALDFNDNGTLAFKMAGSGNFDVITGDVTINGSGKGIDFAQGANTGTAANILDDYEEGSYNATVTLGSGTITNTFANTLHYTKIGRIVHVIGRLYTAHSTSNVTSYRFTLPFACIAGGSAVESGGALKVFRANEISGEHPAGFRAYRIESNNSYVDLAANTTMNGGNFGTTNPHIIVNITYHGA